ncbi:DUF6252 family protein [Flavobacterium sp. ov086]|uniref:DUF6252 family protein n=1 Tax=Flavobacterium sp. ov086 TaxID=1761785 RepID=UPI000B75CD9B|nr:DUF6252 family protein [Flavobacterium sp. ov086]SNR65450.1 hypothetical protein SAMN04487979_11586 [Flavobacterium sp. ov086]
MKAPKFLLLLLIIILNSCSSDNSNEDNPKDPTVPTSKFAMTAKVDDTVWEVNNPYNSNYATKPLFDYYPASEYIQVVGRKNLIDEIRLYIKRSDLKVGTYAITSTTFDASKTQIEVSLNSKGKSQYVVEGSLSITSIDLTAKTVTGTFSFNCVDDYSKPVSASNPVTTKVTNGTFNYKYDFAY